MSDTVIQSYHPTIPHIIVFTKDTCTKCRLTQRVLKSKNIPVLVINLDHDDPEGTVTYELSNIYQVQEAPAVFAFNIWQTPVFWTGFTPDQINMLAQSYDHVLTTDPELNEPAIRNLDTTTVATWVTQAALLDTTTEPTTTAATRPARRLLSSGELSPL